MKEIIANSIVWTITVFVMIAEVIIGLSLLFIIFAPSEQEVQCTTIDGAKWSGNNCYKNGIRINFNDKQE